MHTTREWNKMWNKKMRLTITTTKIWKLILLIQKDKFFETEIFGWLNFEQPLCPKIIAPRNFGN